MKILRNYTFTWKQMSLFKVCLLAIGIAIGAYWSQFFLPYVTSLIIVGIATGLYLTYVTFK